MIFNAIFICVFSQDEQKTRNLSHYLRLESFEFPITDSTELKNIYSTIALKRTELAPHFPNISSANQETKENLLLDWIISYPDEYSSFSLFYSQLVRSYH